MDLKKRKKVSNKILFVISVFILLVGGFFVLILFSKHDKKDVSILDHKVVEKIYQGSSLEECTDLADTDDKVLLFLVFGQMKKDNVLSDSISLSIYGSEAKKILNSDFDVHLSGYIFEGYRYFENGDNITRVKAECPSKSYISKLYGYSTDGSDIYLTIASGFVSNNVLYDLSGVEIGEYNKDEVTKLLDKGTMKHYKYADVGGTYKFEKIDG